MEKGEFNVVKSLSIGFCMESRYSEGPRDWQYLFAITRFRYIEVLFHILLRGKENRSC